MRKNKDRLKRVVAGTVASIMTTACVVSNVANAGTYYNDCYEHSGSDGLILTEAWTGRCLVDGIENANIRCVLSVYDDGCVSVRAFNTSKLGNNEKTRLVHMPYLGPESDDRDCYTDLKNHRSMIDESGITERVVPAMQLGKDKYVEDYTVIDSLGIQKYSSDYLLSIHYVQLGDSGFNNIPFIGTETGTIYSGNIRVPSYFGYPNCLEVGELVGYDFKLKPGTDFNTPKYFNIFGHKFMVCNDIRYDWETTNVNMITEALSGNNTSYFAQYTGPDYPEAVYGNTYLDPVYVENPNYIVTSPSGNSNTPTVTNKTEPVPQTTQAVVTTTVANTTTTTTTQTTTTVNETTTTVSTMSNEERIAELEKEVKELKSITSDLDSRLQPLEQEYARLMGVYKSIIESRVAQVVDVNGDGVVDTADTTEILETYAMGSTGNGIKTYEDFLEYKGE